MLAMIRMDLPKAQLNILHYIKSNFHLFEENYNNHLYDDICGCFIRLLVENRYTRTLDLRWLTQSVSCK